MQMKNLVAAASACAALMVMTNASANTICPFTDHFFIQAPVALHVISAATEGNLSYTQMDTNYFKLSCQDNRTTSGGVLNIQIGLNDKSKCTLTIEDGPFHMNPSVAAVSCGGTASNIFYVGMDHTFGSREYTLKFTN
jgi:hypothetical protein